MIRPFDINNPKDQAVMSAMASFSTTREWPVIKAYLEKELHIMDVNHRMADPLIASRLGAGAFTLQAILDKIEHSVEMIKGKQLRY